MEKNVYNIVFKDGKFYYTNKAGEIVIVTKQQIIATLKHGKIVKINDQEIFLDEKGEKLVLENPQNKQKGTEEETTDENQQEQEQQTQLKTEGADDDHTMFEKPEAPMQVTKAPETSWRKVSANIGFCPVPTTKKQEFSKHLTQKPMLSSSLDKLYKLANDELNAFWKAQPKTPIEKNWNINTQEVNWTVEKIQNNIKALQEKADEEEKEIRKNILSVDEIKKNKMYWTDGNQHQNFWANMNELLANPINELIANLMYDFNLSHAEGELNKNINCFEVEAINALNKLKKIHEVFGNYFIDLEKQYRKAIIKARKEKKSKD